MWPLSLEPTPGEAQQNTTSLAGRDIVYWLVKLSTGKSGTACNSILRGKKREKFDCRCSWLRNHLKRASICHFTLYIICLRPHFIQKENWSHLQKKRKKNPSNTGVFYQEGMDISETSKVGCSSLGKSNGEIEWGSICYISVSYEPESIWLFSFSVWYCVYIMLKSPALGSRLDYEWYPPFIPKQWGNESIFEFT